jgi:hypothetical protein
MAIFSIYIKMLSEILTNNLRRGTMSLYGIDPSVATDRLIGKRGKGLPCLIAIGSFHGLFGGGFGRA